MSKTSKIVIAGLLGFFFSVATLEIDIQDYDNTFFDNYDSYVKVDCKLTQRILIVELDRFTSPEIIPLTYNDSHAHIVCRSNEPRTSNYFYRPKLFLITSSLLI